MYIKKIFLNNFRNLQNKKLNLNSGLNILIGNNGQGKTNFLESIYFMATAKSHRTNIDREMINWNKEKCLIQILIKKKNYEIKLLVSIKGSKKEIQINNTSVDKISELIGILNVVIFSPEDLELIKGGPANRRDFLDVEVSQVSPVYYDLLKKYNHILSQRNKLLKDFKMKKENQNNQLEIWDEQLINMGSKIIYKRIKVIDKLKILARLNQRKITGGIENLEMSYESSLGDIKYDLEDIKFIFNNKLVNNRKKEIDRGYTIYGPHRDDIKLEINKKDVRRYGSQGQQRTVALALKLSELEFMKSEIGEYPVLLLDDVFSELDFNRKKLLLNHINKNIQTILTDTEFNILNELSDKASLFNVHQGKIKKNK